MQIYTIDFPYFTSFLHISYQFNSTGYESLFIIHSIPCTATANPCEVPRQHCVHLYIDKGETDWMK